MLLSVHIVSCLIYMIWIIYRHYLWYHNSTNLLTIILWSAVSKASLIYKNIASYLFCANIQKTTLSIKLHNASSVFKPSVKPNWFLLKSVYYWEKIKVVVHTVFVYFRKRSELKNWPGIKAKIIKYNETWDISFWVILMKLDLIPSTPGDVVFLWVNCYL